jgi:hypothetical protein
VTVGIKDGRPVHRRRLDVNAFQGLLTQTRTPRVRETTSPSWLQCDTIRCRVPVGGYPLCVQSRMSVGLADVEKVEKKKERGRAMEEEDKRR